MKKILFSLIFTISLLCPLAVAGTANAVNVVSTPGGACVGSNGQPTTAASSPACADNATNSTSNPIYGPSGIITIVVRILSMVVGIIALFVIIISGYKFVTAGGDSQGVAEARKSLIYALIGVAVAALGQVLVAFVLDRVK